MSEIILKSRVLSTKFIDVEVMASRATVNVGLLNQGKPKNFSLKLKTFAKASWSF